MGAFAVYTLVDAPKYEAIPSTRFPGALKFSCPQKRTEPTIASAKAAINQIFT